MKTLTTLLAAGALALSANAALARDIDSTEARTLQDNGTIQTTDKLTQAALAAHPGATITDTELENEYGKYIYKVELRDKAGVEWDLELDAVTGQVYKNHQDN
jgi:uncharacterized membrane protein YkoI